MAAAPQRSINRPMAHCPSCLTELAKPPKRRIDCPACGAPIFVRAAQGYVSASLVTLEEAAMLDLLGKTRGVPRHEDLVAEVRRAWGPRGAVSAAVTRWGLALGDNDAQSFCYAIALALCQAGVEHEPMLRRSHEPELKAMAASGIISHVQVLSLGGCEVCASQNGKTVPMAEALRRPPLPHPKCEYDGIGPRGFCRCTYVAGGFA